MTEDLDWSPPEEFDEYRLVRQLGRGAMGQVYLAHDIVLDRPVAVKFLGALNPDPVERERFLVEARAIARIQHPNVMSIYRVGEVKGRLYLVTEYVRGQNLADLELPLPWQKVLEIGVSLARGLAAAHRQGVLHRDIKLSNAVIDEGGQVKLLDFGLAKLVDASATDASTSRPGGEKTEDLVVRAAANARQMVVQRLADTLKLEKPDATAPTPKATHNADTADPADAPDAEKGESPSGSGHRDKARGLRGWRSKSASITRAGTVMGTPHYMAPELWLADPASRRSDVYALGVLLYILGAGRPPHDAESPFELAIQVQEQDPQPLLELTNGVDPRLAQIIDRCLLRDPYDRYAAGDELRTALELVAAPVRAVAIPTGNPYRGLQAFEAEHRSLFFGRSAEIRSVVERLRTDAFVVVAGDSGVGKSSLCRAGVVPAVCEGTLDPSRTWRSVVMTPGRYPRQSFISVIARGFGLTEDEVSMLLGEAPESLVRALRKQLGDTGACLIFIDQFEEFVTISEPGEVDVIGPLIVRLLAGIPSLRVLATVRGDFLTRVVTVPGLGEEVARGIFLLRPLSPEGAREAVVGPAQAHGVGFESDELIEELVEAGVKGSLPLLQFALAELWESRDKQVSVISAAELRKIGGVTGALARHADGVLATLLPAQRTAARRLLMRLVTLENTRASLTEDELSAADDASRAALDALVRGRLLVIKESGDRMVYEIAHEALVGGWAQLAGWLEDEKEARAVRYRLEAAASEWERLGKRGEGLWSAAQTVETAILDRTTLRPREIEFLEASATNAARSRLVRRIAIAAVPITLVVAYSVFRWQSHAETERKIEGYLADYRSALTEARSSQRVMEVRRREALELFDARDGERAEPLWTEARAHSRDALREYAAAAQALETAFSLDPERADLQTLVADVLLERVLLSDESGQSAITEEILPRLRLYDHDGTRMARWEAPATLRIETQPPGAKVTLERYRNEADGRMIAVEPRALGVSPLVQPGIEGGSYRLSFELEGRTDVVYPVVLERGEDQAIAVALPPRAEIPEGYVYVPAGSFLFGAAGDEELRRAFYEAGPAHEVWTGPYLIGRNELTYADYITYLDALTPEERDRRRPRADATGTENSFQLERREDGVWQLVTLRAGETVTTPMGELYTYSGRAHPQAYDWRAFPVNCITVDDVLAYVDWLNREGPYKGVRLCSEAEWERAARGADLRIYPHGDGIAPSDANWDATYERNPVGMGPDPVGSHPQSRSPFGLEDMAGNVFEWTVSVREEDGYVARGGAFFFDAMTQRSINRGRLDPTFRAPTLGVRLCMTYP
ncbi:MAG: SUMF1/EgtB/PvdO family nonheme iron enzyme [Nannocystaceae bacterium]